MSKMLRQICAKKIRCLSRFLSKPLLGSSKISPTKKMSSSLRTTNGFIPAKVAEGKRWYVEFYCLDPETGRMRRKRVSVPKIKGVTARRRYANDMVININDQLSQGWNPYLSLNNPEEYTLFDDVCEKYYRYLYKLTESDIMRVKTYNGYTSFLNVFRGWNSEQHKPVCYVYQLKSSVVSKFLDWLWLDCGKAARTRDNYLSWLRSFAGWLMEKNYISEDFTANLTAVQGKRKCAKNRTVIPKETMLAIREYCSDRNRHYLLACYVLYYCFIRPKEMSHIRIGDISVKGGTISVRAEYSKNRKDAVVTLPDCVLKLMLDLDVLSNPADWYLFSSGFRPGPAHHPAKHFGDFWTYHLKKDLRLPSEYKFYSLKDTGITDLIKARTDLLSVRDQARHHSLQMTDLYTPLETRTANESIRHHESYF